jgi:hypothetical protein
MGDSGDSIGFDTMASCTAAADGADDKSFEMDFPVSKGELAGFRKSGIDCLPEILLAARLLASGNLSIVGDWGLSLLRMGGRISLRIPGLAKGAGIILSIESCPRSIGGFRFSEDKGKASGTVVREFDASLTFDVFSEVIVRGAEALRSSNLLLPNGMPFGPTRGWWGGPLASSPRENDS